MTAAPTGSVYLLHFDRPLGHARHYIGWALDVHARVDTHLAGKGSKLVRAAVAAGIHVELVRVWENKGQAFEHQLKKGRCGPRFCPVCVIDRRRRARDSMRSVRAARRSRNESTR